MVYCGPFYSSEYTVEGLRPVLSVTYGYTMTAGVLDGQIWALQNCNSDSFLTVPGTNPLNNTNVYQTYIEDYIPTVNQQVKFEYQASSGTYLIRPMCSQNGAGKVLDIQRSGGAIYSGRNVQVYTDNDPISQEWYVIPVNCESFRIVPKANMSLSLTACGTSDGTATGKSATSPGNIFVQTTDLQSRAQNWFLVDANGDFLELFTQGNTVQSGLYYITNQNSGRYLHKDSNSANCARGTLEYLEPQNVQWLITRLGDGYCTIQNPLNLRALCYDNGSIKLLNMTETVADKFKWRISSINGGYIQNKLATANTVDLNRFYLTDAGNVYSSQETVTANDYVGTQSQRWNFHLAEDYKEADETISFSNIVMDIATTAWASISNSQGRSMAEAKHFYYKFLSNPVVTINQSVGAFIGTSEGTAYMIATHKTTGREYSFTIQVCIPTVVVPCVYGQAIHYGNEIVNFPTSVLPYISEYASRLSGATWNAYDNGVITFDAENMSVRGIGTGFAWLEAKKNGQTVLICDVYVENILRQFDPDVQDYLFSNGEFLGTASIEWWEELEPVDPLILRTEWFLYAVELFNDGYTSHSEINAALGEKFGLSAPNSYSYSLFIAQLERGASGGLSRDNVMLSFDGLRCMFDFFWFNYVAYAITTLDTVNVYTPTPTTTQDIVDEKAYAKQFCTQKREKTYELLEQSSWNTNSNNMVIGTTADNKSWHDIANGMNASYFYNENYSTIVTDYAYEFQSANRCFILDGLRQSKTIYCSHNPIYTLTNYPTSAYAKELRMIEQYYSSISMSVSYQETVLNGNTLWQIIATAIS